MGNGWWILQYNKIFMYQSHMPQKNRIRGAAEAMMLCPSCNRVWEQTQYYKGYYDNIP